MGSWRALSSPETPGHVGADSIRDERYVLEDSPRRREGM